MIRTILKAFATLLLGAVIGWQARYLFDNDFDYVYGRQIHLTWAASRGDTTEMRKLLSAGADPDAAPVSSMGEGQEPILAASESAKPDAVSLLLESGAKVNPLGHEGETPLDNAEYAKKRAEKTIEILRDHGGKTYRELYPQKP